MKDLKEDASIKGIPLPSLSLYSLDSLVDELNWRNYDFLEDVDDWDLRNEFDNRGLNCRVCKGLDEEKERLEKLMHEAYIMSIEVKPNLEKIRDFVEKNFKI